MQGIDLTKPGEKKKLLGAAALGLIAITFLWWTLFGFGGNSSTPRRPTPSPSPTGRLAGTNRQSSPVDEGDLAALRPVELVKTAVDSREGDRNIFAYYEPTPTPSPAPSIATPTPTPIPPVLLATISPSNVYARTGDFALEVTGDKFQRDMKIFIDRRELPTKFQSPQQLSTTIPSSFITAPGSHKVVVQTSDEKIYSNELDLSVAAPPVPNYSYIGMYSTSHHVDTAMLQDKSNRDVVSVQRGDVLGGRFRVTSISEKELVLVDTSLKIKHSLAMSEGERGAGAPLGRPTPKVDAEDDEP